MLTKRDNDRLTQVVGDAPMARLMRENYWMPFARSESLKPGLTQKVRLFGENYVAFRGDTGVLGFVDERCPHRGVSLALARVEGCNLRCIFHGWQIDPTGAVVEIPSEGERSAEISARVKFNRYHTRESAGLMWVFLGQGEPPAFPDLPFMRVPETHCAITRSVVPCNWLQGLEGALDSSHVSWLHRSWAGRGAADPVQIRVSPTYDVRDTPYGMRAGAVRPQPDGNILLRIAEYLTPFIALTTGRVTGRDDHGSLFMSVPIDNENHLLFWGLWEDAPITVLGAFAKGDYSLDDYAIFSGARENDWGQDREEMANGHFSGFTDRLLQEDVVVQMSMGAIADRTREHIVGTDLAVMKCRHSLLTLLKQFEAGEAVDGSFRRYSAGHGKLPFNAVVPPDFDWDQTKAYEPELQSA